MRSSKDIDILCHMMQHCQDIDQAIQIFGDDIDTFVNNRVYQHAVTNCLLQLGELTTRLSEEFKASTSDEIDWIGLKVFRNICAHNYGSIRFDQTWNTMHTFLPQFIAFCEKELQEENDEDLSPEI